MKKKRQLVITVILMLFVLTAAGCGDDKEARLEDEVAKLEQQVNDLQKENDLQKQSEVQTQNDTKEQSDTQMETKATELTNIETAPEAATDGTTESTKQEQTDFAALESEVNAQVEKAADVVVDSEESKKVEQYFALKREIEQLDQKLDLHDDYLEAQYRQKSLTFEELKNQERNLDALENKLDDAEDQLEIRFGMDD